MAKNALGASPLRAFLPINACLLCALFLTYCDSFRLRTVIVLFITIVLHIYRKVKFRSKTKFIAQCATL